MGRRPSAIDLRSAFWNHTSSITSLELDRKGRLLGSIRTAGFGGLAMLLMAPRLVQFPPRPTCNSFTAAAFTTAISRPGTIRKHPLNRSLCVVLLLLLLKIPPAAKWTTFTLLGCTTNPPLLEISRRRYFRRINALENDSQISMARPGIARTLSLSLSHSLSLMLTNSSGDRIPYNHTVLTKGGQTAF